MAGWPFTSVTRSETASTTRCSAAARCPAPCRSTGSPTRSRRPSDAFQVVADELMLDGNSRQNLATFCQTWEEPEVHRLMDLAHRQEHDRQGRVPADRRDRAALRAHAGRPVERAGVGEHRRCVGDRIVGGVHARRDGGQVAVAGEAAAAEGKPTDRPNMVCGPVQVVWHKFAKLLGHRDARGADVARPLRDGRRRHARAGRREHDLGRADARRHLHRRVRAGEADSPRRSTQLQADTGLDVDIHVDGASGGFLAPFCAPDLDVGLPAAAGEVDQHVGSQVRAGPARRRLGRVARRRPSCPTT